ncbi:hypothetical protein IFR05_007749 [Cadophora sp. M221]|nr:hypothetical protein IFR05_007749 [Cadophora sp. M221]
MASSSSTGQNNSRPTDQGIRNRPSNQDRSPSSTTSATIGVKTNSAEAEADTWDDDFEDVDEQVFGPSKFPENEDSMDEEDDSKEDKEHKETVVMHIYLKDHVKARDGVMQSTEREGENTNVQGDEEEDDLQDQEENTRLDSGRMMRSMSPSPQPPPADH